MDYPLRRPYLIIPKLIEQPTWGGDYILKLKKWKEKPFAQGLTIGQSYELFGGSKLCIGVDSSDGERFIGEVGFPDRDGINPDLFSLRPETDYIELRDLITQHPNQTLGADVSHRFGMMPLLIKINHARGNSFQLHKPHGMKSDTWKSKAESWYYLEPGLLTFGIQPGISVEKYRACCLRIDAAMRTLSEKVLDRSITLDEARTQASAMIHSENPWQFVQTIEANAYDLIDLSPGGLHHSWEDDPKRYPIGNVIYEIQQDVMDPVSTIRSFDQGKIKADGTVRPLSIDDYFTFLDVSDEHNDIANARVLQTGNTVLSTAYYGMDVRTISTTLTIDMKDSFHHVYVRDGDVRILTDEGSVSMSQGFSCFIPAAAGHYQIESNNPNTVTLISYVPDSQS